ncbi:MAG: hypothetical protein ABSE55_16840 [Terracidiphilus sp.]|jgi:hypothetical protein
MSVRQTGEDLEKIRVQLHVEHQRNKIATRRPGLAKGLKLTALV